MTGEPRLCGFCRHEPASTTIPAPVGSRDARFALEVCAQCADRLLTALNDLPWLRYVLSRYVPAGGPHDTPRWEWLNQ